MVLTLLLSFLVRISKVQDYIVKKITAYVSSQTKAKVSIGSFDWNMFDDLRIKNFYLGDKNGDTLLYVDEFFVDFKMWSLLNKEVRLNEFILKDSKIFLSKNEQGEFNFAHLLSKNESKTKSKKFDWVAEVGDFKLYNTSLVFDDKKSKSRMSIAIPSFITYLKTLDIDKQQIFVNSIDITSPQIRFEQYDSTRIKSPSEAFKSFIPKGMQLGWNVLNIENGTLFFDNSREAKKDTSVMDFNHLKFKEVDVILKNGIVLSDSIFSVIHNIHLKEKSGFEISTATTHLSVTPRAIVCDKLQLATPNSILANKLALRYDGFEDFDDFINKVVLDVNLLNSHLSFKDFEFFSKGVRKVAHNVLNIDGQIKGRISRLEGKEIKLATGKTTTLMGSFYATGLPKLSETFLTVRLEEFIGSVSDLKSFAPHIKLPDNTHRLGLIKFNGGIDGFLSDFVARGNIFTALGSASSDLNLKYDFKTGESLYSGNLNLKSFDLATWFGDTLLGRVSFVADVRGKGFQLNDLNTKITGNINLFEFKKYQYQDLTVNGTVRGRSFEGELEIRDPNVDIVFSGLADLGQSIPRYKFHAVVNNVSLKDLKISNQNLALKGEVDADFSGKNIDDLEGLLTLNNAYLTRNEESYFIKETTIEANEIGNGKKKIKIDSDNLEAEVKGRFSLMVLPKLIKNKFNSAIYLQKDTNVYPLQDFTFDVRIYDSLSFLKFIDPKIQLIRNSFVRGYANTASNVLDVSSNIPELIYNNIKLRNVSLKANVDKNSTKAKFDVDKIVLKDSVFVDTFTVSLHDIEKGYAVELFGKDKKGLNRLSSTINLYPSLNFLNVKFENTNALIGGKNWDMTASNNLRVGKKRIDLKDFRFTSGDQQISLQSYMLHDTVNCLQVKVSNTSLNSFLAIYNTKLNEVYADLDGEFDVINVFGKKLFLGNLVLADLRLGKIVLGNLKLNAELNTAKNQIDIIGGLDGMKNLIDIKGFYSLGKDQNLDIQAEVIKGDLEFLNHSFFDRYVQNVDGKFKGNLHVFGPVKKLRLGGDILIDKADVTVSYLKTRYRIENEEISINPRGYIDIGQVRLNDIKNNEAIGKGRIYHEHLKRFTLELSVSTQNMQFLNTTAKDNRVFYGTIFGSGTVIFTGTVPQVDIRAYAKMSEGTHVYIPINSSYEVNGYSFYKFTNKRLDSFRAIGKTDKIFTKGVNFTVDVDVTPEAELDIILDQSSGDILSSRGEGNLKIDVKRNGDFGIYGLYEINDGSYLFTLQNIVNKRFKLNKGGSIAFNGDLRKAQVNADAIYQVRSSPYDLLYDPQQSNVLSSEVEQRAKNRMLIRLMLKLKGVLENPTVSFDIEPQDADPSIKALLDGKLQVVRGTESELNRQVFGLLVLNRFLPVGAAVNNTNASLIGGGVTNTVSEFLSTQLSIYASSFLESINLKDLDLNVNFRQYDQQSNNINTQISQTQFDTRRELQLALTKRFLNNRLSINVGGNVDFGDRYSFDQGSGTFVNNPNTFVTGDFQVEYSLTKKGNLKLRAVNRGDYDNFYQRNRNRTSLGLSFRKDFDNFKDLFGIKNKEDNELSEPKIDIEGKNEEDSKVPIPQEAEGNP